MKTAEDAKDVEEMKQEAGRALPFRGKR